MDSEPIDLSSVDLSAMPPAFDFGTAFENMVGDADIGGGSGRIEIDRTIPSHPVIRFLSEDADEDGGGGGGGGGGDDEPLEPGADPEEPYEDPEEDDSEDAIDADGNEISNDAGSLDDDNGDYCNEIFGNGGPSGAPPGNNISNTCSKGK